MRFYDKVMLALASNVSKASITLPRVTPSMLGFLMVVSVFEVVWEWTKG